MCTRIHDSSVNLSFGLAGGVDNIALFMLHNNRSLGGKTPSHMYIIYTIRYAMVVMLFPISYYLPLFYPYIIRTILSCHGQDYII